MAVHLESAIFNSSFAMRDHRARKRPETGGGGYETARRGGRFRGRIAYFGIVATGVWARLRKAPDSARCANAWALGPQRVVVAYLPLE